MLIRVASFLGAIRSLEAKLLPEAVGVESVNQRPGRGDLRAWRMPASVAAVPALTRTIYRMGRDVASDANYWLGWPTVVHAVRGFVSNDTTERTYFTGDGVPKVTDNVIGLASPPYPTTARLLGVPAPILQPVLTEVTPGTGDDETRYYVFTYVTDAGEESAPSPVSLPIVCKPGAEITVSNLGSAAPTGNYGITLKRIYRTQSGSTNTEFFFLREVAIGTASTTDDARALQETLATKTWDTPPANLKHLRGLWNGMMAGISGRSIRYCEAYTPYAWPIEYETKPADVTPVALGSFQQTLVVLTNGKPIAITGTSPDAMQDTVVESDQACVSEESVQSFGHGVVYASPDGLAYVGTARAPGLLTAGLMLQEDWQALVPTSIVGAQYEGIYIGFYNDGAGLKALMIDPLNPTGIYFFSTGYTAAFHDRLQDALYVLDGTAVKRWNADAAFMTARFRSKVFRLPKPGNLGYAEVIASSYPVTLRVWSDYRNPVTHAVSMVLRATISVPSREVLPLPSGFLSDDWQLEVEVPAGRAVQGVALAETVAELRQV